MADLTFNECVLSIFNKWSALKLAIEHGMGGPPQLSKRKLIEMANSIATFCFSQDATFSRDIAIELEDLLDDNFDTILEDDSSDVVGQLLWDLSRQWLSGDKDSVRNYVSNLNKNTENQAKKSEENSEKTDEMDVGEEENDSSSTSAPSNQPDEDGWVVVQKAKSKRH